jgi:mannose-6-phosphate isomerase-like protein (cupin superfamily)
VTSSLTSRPADPPAPQLGRIQARTLIGGDTAGRRLVHRGGAYRAQALAGPLQAHRHENGCWYVAGGECTAQAGDEEVREAPGALIFAPGHPARLLEPR